MSPVNDKPTYEELENQIAEIKRQKEIFQKQQSIFSSALNAIAEIILFNENPDNILENANRIIGETLQVDRALIYKVSFENNRITGLCEWLKIKHSDIAPTLGQYTSLSMFLSAFTEIKNTRKYLESYATVVNKHFIENESNKNLHEQLNIKSLLWFPFYFDEHGFYLFTLNQILEQRYWTEEEIYFLASAAKQVSLALHKIRLLSERNRVREDEDKFKILFEKANDGICIMNLNLEILMLNDSFAQMHGYTIEEMKGMYIRRMETPELSQQADAPERKKKVLAGKTLKFEVDHYHKSGKLISLEVTSNLMPFGKEKHIVAFHRDITKRKQAEQALKKTLQELENSNKTKDKFFKIIAHDLRNPFTGIMGLTELMEEKLIDANNDDLSEILKFTQMIHSASISSFNLIENLTEWSKSQTGEIDITLKNISVKYLLSNIIPVVRGNAFKKYITIEEHIAEDDTVYADIDMTETIIRNLLTNAIKFTYPNGKIIISTHRRSGFLEISIIDTGVGIEPEKLNKIFRIDSKFSELGTAKEKGTGLGLILCKEFVEKQGGKIWITSEVGVGSTFTFTLPVGKAIDFVI